MRLIRRRTCNAPALLPPLPQVTKESTDEFVGRMQGYLMLYAAAMQVRRSLL